MYVMRLANKVAIITGAASGFGRASSLKFTKEGASVTMVDMNAAGLEETRKMISAQNPQAKTLTIVADVSKEQEVKGFVDSTVKEFGGLDIIFNNAGIEGTSAFLADMPYDDFTHDLAINLHSVFLGSKYAISYMKDHGGGVIVNMSSLGGLVALPGSCTYVAAKHAIIGLTKSVAAEYGEKGIRANAICPGFVMTELHRRVITKHAGGNEETIKGMIESNSSSTPLKRYGEPEEIADLALFLASPESSYINGVAIAIDGGFSIL